MSFVVLPPASHLTASPLGVQRRVARAQALAGETGQAGAHSMARAQPQLDTDAAAAAVAHRTAAPRAAVPAASSSAGPRPSMGLFAHHPSAAFHSDRDPSLLSSEDRSLPLVASGVSAAAAAEELAQIYRFMDEAQARTRALDSQIVVQQELNRNLLVSSSSALIALQTQIDQAEHENALMAQQMEAIVAENKSMLARARGDSDGAAAHTDDATRCTLTAATVATPASAARHASSGSSRDAAASVSSGASHYTSSPRFEGLTIASRPPSQQRHHHA